MTETVQKQNSTPEMSIEERFDKGLQSGLHPAPPAPAEPAITAPANTGAPANELKNAVSNTVTAVGEAATEGVNVINDAIADPKATLNSAAKKGKTFFEEMDIGKILGGLLGLGGAWFLGSMFGEGIMSSILMIGLAIPLMMIGSDKLGGMINGWMGKKPDQQTAMSQQVDSPQNHIAQSQQPVLPLVQKAGQTKHSVELSEAELNNLIASHTSPTVSLPNGQFAMVPVEVLDQARQQAHQLHYNSGLALNLESNGSLTPVPRGLPQPAAPSAAAR